MSRRQERRRNLKKHYWMAMVVALTIIGVLDVMGVTAPPSSVFNRDWCGTSRMKEILENNGYTVKCIFSTPEILRMTEPPDVLVIIRPTCGYDEREVAAILEFVRNGGGLLIADDFGLSYNIVKAFGVEFLYAEKKVRVLEYKNYYKQPSLPMVTVNLGRIASDLNIGNKNLTIVLNDANALKISGTSAIILGTTSNESFLDVDGDEYLDDNEKMGPLPVVIAARYGNGSVVIISDSSIFWNDMIDVKDNSEFLKVVIRWLSGGKEGAVIAFDESKLGWEDRISLIGFFSSVFFGSMIIHANMIMLMVLMIAVTPMYGAMVAWHSGGPVLIRIDIPRGVYYRRVFRYRVDQFRELITRNPVYALKETHECLKLLLEDVGLTEDIINNLDRLDTFLVAARRLHMNVPMLDIHETLRTLMEVENILRRNVSLGLFEVRGYVAREREIIDKLLGRRLPE